MVVDDSVVACDRCKKAGADRQIVSQRWAQKNDGRWMVLRFMRYHQKCIPPVWWHHLAGSLPASHKSLSGASLSMTALPGQSVVIATGDSEPFGAKFSVTFSASTGSAVVVD